MTDQPENDKRLAWIESVHLFDSRIAAFLEEADRVVDITPEEFAEMAIKRPDQLHIAFKHALALIKTQRDIYRSQIEHHLSTLDHLDRMYEIVDGHKEE